MAMMKMQNMENVRLTVSTTIKAILQIIADGRRTRSNKEIREITLLSFTKKRK